MCYDKTKAAGRSAEKTCPLSGDPNIHTYQSVWYNYWTSAYKNSDVKSGPAETVPVMGIVVLAYIYIVIAIVYLVHVVRYHCSWKKLWTCMCRVIRSCSIFGFIGITGLLSF